MQRTQRAMACTGAACILLLMPQACRTTEQIAPPVDLNMASQGVTVEALLRGRDIYLRQCASCHVAEPVDRYTLEEWEDIITRMAPKSKLNEIQTMELRRYVQAALNRPDPNAQ